MALHTLGLADVTLPAIAFASADALAPADLASISQGIVGDKNFGTNPTGILATGSTHTNTVLDSLVFVAGGPLAAIRVGMLVSGRGIVPGTFVVAKPTATSVTLSVASTATASGVKIGFAAPVPGNRLSFEGLLELPGGRGTVKVFPGDVVAIDNTGWPILVSAASIAYTGSDWVFT